MGKRWLRGTVVLRALEAGCTRLRGRLLNTTSAFSRVDGSQDMDHVPLNDGTDELAMCPTCEEG